MEVTDFSCQLNDFSKLDYNINEFLKYDTKLNLTGSLNLKLGDDIECLLIGEYYHEALNYNFDVLILLTTKGLNLYSYKNNMIKFLKTIDLLYLESLVIIGNVIYFVKNTDNIIEMIKVVITNKNLLQIKDEQTKPNDLLKTTFYFVISIWKIVFILRSIFIRVIRMESIKDIDKMLTENNYITKIYNYIFKLNDLFIFNNIKVLVNYREAFRRFIDSNNKDVFDKDKRQIVREQEKNTSINEGFSKIDGSAFLLLKENRSYEYTGKYSYARVILKLYEEVLVLYDFFTNNICFIDLLTAVEFYHSKLVVVIYIQDPETKIKTKIVLFNNSLGDYDSDLFKNFLVKLLLLKRKETFKDRFRSAMTISELLASTNDNITLYSMIRNNKRMENKISKELKKVIDIHIETTKSFCCCRKKKNNKEVNNQCLIL
jgi:hypothetical protein